MQKTNLRSLYFIVLILFIQVYSYGLLGQNHELWYTYPAKYWNSQALHLGNGYMGASFFGGVQLEKFALTEGSMWLGGPFRGDWEEYGINPNAHSYIDDIREAVVKGNIRLADSLTAEYYLGDNTRYGSFTSIGDLILRMDDHNRDYSDYLRKLKLDDASGLVQYQLNDILYSREYFCSYPDKVLVMKIKSSSSGNVSFSLRMNIIQSDYELKISDNTYAITGLIDGGDREFSVMIKTIPYGGKSINGNDFIGIQNADSVVVLVNASTDYKLEYPSYLGGDPEKICELAISRAEQLGYDKLKQSHTDDYSQLYSRVSINLNSDPDLNALPTSKRWERFKDGEPDTGLKELVFNLGRYLIISSSRPGTLPANLQGKWNTFYVSPWSGNYQANINIQEIYWPCGPVNLIECQEPYIDWTKDLVMTGREIARLVYGTNGWVSHTTGNIWGHAAPAGSIPWGVYPLANVWHCQHAWEQFTFTMDTLYLAETAYPIIKEAALFWMENLVEYKDHLIVAPSISAEHGAYLKEDEIEENYSEDSYNRICYNIPGAFQDAQMIRDLFTICDEAGRILALDQSFRDSLLTMQSKLLPHKIGKFGQLQEWYEDIDNPEVHHRHISHMYAVCPGNQIHPLTTPELAKAAKVSLNMRGDGRYSDDRASGGNWSRCWRIWCWTRLMDGNRANKIFNEMLTEQGFENLLTYQHDGYHWGRKDLLQEPDSIYLHFQLDGSASTPGFMAEMLLQSHLGEIILLPSLPDEWKDGSVSGLRARGGYTVDISWENYELTGATIRGNSDRMPKLRLKDRYINPGTDKRINIVPLY